MKVLHVLGSLGRGGVETWLMHVWRNVDREKLTFDFLLHTEGNSVYQKEAEALGSKIIRCTPTQRPVLYSRRFSSILEEFGPYDVVHSHVHHFSALPLTVARRWGVRTRIAHSHQAPRPHRRPLRAVYEACARVQLNRSMTHGLAISTNAAAGLFGRNWKRNNRVSVLLYGFDFSAFRALPDRSAQKRLLGLPEDRLVVGHIGRFVEQKNHEFLVPVFDALIRRKVSAHLVLVGTGPLMERTRDELAKLELLDRCTFAGDQSDVAPWLRAMDLFLLPSLFEGLGIVAVEAQAAGTRLLLSDQVPPEVDIIPERIERLSLSSGKKSWAEAAEKILRRDLDVDDQAFERVSGSHFGITRCLRELTAHYCSSPRQTHEAAPEVKLQIKI